MELLCFAHKNEAGFFLKNLSPIHIEENLWQCREDLMLLITGEGIWNTLFKLPRILERYNIKKMTNLGCAGLLRVDQDVYLKQTHAVRWVTGEKTKNDAHFQSFELSSSGIDCISAYDRVKEEKYKSHLSNFAQIVDRELWALAKLAKEYKLPLQSFKYISDLANHQNICHSVSQEAEQISKNLYDFWVKNTTTTTFKETGDILSEKLFHFTNSQKSKWLKDLNFLKSKFIPLSIEDILQKKLDIHSLIEKDIRPKERTKLLLQKSFELLNPYQFSVQKKIDSLLLKEELKTLNISYDKNLDKKGLKLNIYINNQKDLDQLLLNLSKLPVNEVNEIIEGNF